MHNFSSRWTRRAVLGHVGATLTLSTLPARLLRAEEEPHFRSDPFSLGVASGYPGADTVVLWTRLAPSPLEPGGGMPADTVVPVTWRIARDEHMRAVVQQGICYATPEWAHSVHVEPTGLEPARDYWYQFNVGSYPSTIGRTRTAPRPGMAMTKLRMAVASCQQYEHGYFVAYRHMLADDLDLVVHVGDYIYENTWGSTPLRSHGAPEAFTLDDYRARYALYRGEKELQDAHARYPWLVTWDDHEVDNDYAGDTSEDDDPRDWFLARRAAAYRAYYEHMPLPRRAVPFGAQMRLHTRRTFGNLLNLYMLDTRQYRSPLACTRPAFRNSNVVNCPELRDTARTKLGNVQESWLAGRLASSGARWNMFAQGTLMAAVDHQAGPAESFSNDSWNGYPAARARFLDVLYESKASNPVILSGDIHAFAVARQHRYAQSMESPLIASEFVTTSITSQGTSQPEWDALRRENVNLMLANTLKRGYLLLDVQQQRLRTQLIAMDSVTERDAGRSVLATYIVENGNPAPIAI